jgi:hypothetical protein
MGIIWTCLTAPQNTIRAAVSFVVVVVVRMYIVGLLIIIIKLNGHHACYYTYVVYQYLIFY